MAYYDDRRYREPRDRYARPDSYGDPYEDRDRYTRRERDSYVPRASTDLVGPSHDYRSGPDYGYDRAYTSQRPRRPGYENMRRASSVSSYDPYYDTAPRSSRPRRSRRPEERSQ